jgi:hypothetical protein
MMTIISLRRITSLLLLTMISVGCATSTMNTKERTEAYVQYIASENLEGIKRISAFRFNGWSSLGEEHLIISTQINKPYLISLRSRCRDLLYANGIQIHNNGSTLHRRVDAISVIDPGNMGFRCFIDNIYLLTKEQKKALQKIGREDKDEEESIEDS